MKREIMQRFCEAPKAKKHKPLLEDHNDVLCRPDPPGQCNPQNLSPTHGDGKEEGLLNVWGDDPPQPPNRKQPKKDGKKQRNPKCAKCNNHGKDVPLLYHKRDCLYKHCPCLKCKNTDEKRDVMKRQISLRRWQLQRREMNMPDTYPDELTDLPTTPSSTCSESAISPTSYSIPTQAGGISSQEIYRLQESLEQVFNYFSKQPPSPTFIYALYLAILKDNKYNPETVINKILEGDNEYRKLVWPLQQLKSLTPPSPSSSYWPNIGASTSPSTSSSLLASTHPHCYSSFLSPNYSFYPPNNPALMSSIPPHVTAGIEATTNSTPPYVYFGISPFTTTASSATSNSTAPDVGARVYSPPNSRHLPDGHTSGESRDSHEYKEESDKDSGGNGTVLPTSVRDSSAIVDMRRRPRSYRPDPVYWRQERLETAANA